MEKVDYWDSIEGRQKQRDATPDELAAIELRKNPPLQSRKAGLKERTNAARASAIYRNIFIPFPAEQKEIQFRNEQDEKNLTVKTLGAQIMVYRGAPETEVQFTCADNSVATMTAAQFVDAGMAVLAAKEAVFYAFKAVKDMIEAAGSDEDLAAAVAALEALQQ